MLCFPFGKIKNEKKQKKNEKILENPKKIWDMIDLLTISLSFSLSLFHSFIPILIAEIPRFFRFLSL